MADSSNDDDDRFEQAARWHLRLRDDGAPALLREYDAWLAADPRRASAMAEAEALLGALRRPAVDLADEAGVQPPAAPARRRRPRYAAAACVALLATGTLWMQLGGYDRMRSDAATAVGEIRSLRLGDGSVAILDTDSALKVEFGADRRRVRLYRGRARFEVARDPARPFVVDVPAGSARALGTVFDVRLDGGHTRIGVLEGRVEVRAAGGGSRAVLQAGQRAWLGDGGVVPGTDADADADSGGAAAWRDGQLVFYRAPLAEVVDELARYRRGAVYVRDERLRRMPVSGVFETADPDAGLAALEHTLQLRAIRLGRWLTVFY